MLIITRRPGEKIMLGDDIVVRVMEIVGTRSAPAARLTRSRFAAPPRTGTVQG